MQMIDVLSRLAALDSGNSNVINHMSEVKAKPVAESVAQLPELNDLSHLRALSGLKPLAECGMMDSMSASPMQHQTPASFSINASAASGDEVAGMLTQIMNLAGVVKGGGEAPPASHAGMLTGEPPEDKSMGMGGDSEGEVMRSMMDKLNGPEDEGASDLMLGEPGADELGTGDEGTVGGDMMGGEMDGGADTPVAAMADEVEDMADQLANTSKEELGLESYDNTPNSPHSAPAYDNDKMAYQPNASKTGDRMDGNMPKGNATFEDQLYAEYKNFVSEAKKAKKDYDGDGKVESGKAEYFGSKDKAIKKAIAKK